MDHLNISEQIGEGIYPDEPRVVACWNIEGRAESPIRIAFEQVRGELKPNTDTVMPANVAEMLVQSGYDVTVKYDAILNPEVDQHIEESEAALELRTRAAELRKKTIPDLKAAIEGLDASLLTAVLEAEKAEGEGKTRTGAVEVLEAAIAALMDTPAS